MFAIERAMAARNSRRELFDEGDYLPLKVTGSRSRHIIAFARRRGEQCAAVIVPRLLTSVIGANELPLGQEVWEDTSVEPPANVRGEWRNVFTGEAVSGERRISVAEALKRFPVAMLIGE